MSQTAQIIRSDHPNAYRDELLARRHLGEWARILGTTERHGRERYVIEWENGDRDEWPVDDPTDSYELR